MLIVFSPLCHCLSVWADNNQLEWRNHAIGRFRAERKISGKEQKGRRPTTNVRWFCAYAAARVSTESMELP